ncbi:hypothetical protein H6G51_07175 [Limnothrix sp. FACHB-708]|uniref:hypothetical protein n=1 Tax=unclassified Limnothrix TaxID=2632864 RepID=UPI001681F49D|nr:MULTISPECIES: hypothetical protein [unclassified Limnothrix]MBD2553056.1 hypothetical protein [Limnothrix sp. FACHB-708]MBD2589133.1 hypothetical protein [Limnothrix sp. FACHB-406]
MIEDYASAFVERAQDQAVLAKADRRIAAMHMGGIVIECRLKALILGYFPENQRYWRPHPRSEHQPSQHCNISNPGHNLEEALNKLEEIGVIPSPSSQIRDALTAIQNPLPGYPFINLRYYGGSLEASDYERWKVNYQALTTWLNRQSLQSS